MHLAEHVTSFCIKRQVALGPLLTFLHDAARPEPNVRNVSRVRLVALALQDLPLLVLASREEFDIRGCQAETLQVEPIILDDEYALLDLLGNGADVLHLRDWAIPALHSFGEWSVVQERIGHARVAAGRPRL